MVAIGTKRRAADMTVVAAVTVAAVLVVLVEKEEDAGEGVLVEPQWSKL